MSRDPCQTCELLKEFYRLKVNQFLRALGDASAWPPTGRAFSEEELTLLKEESLAALRGLIRHAQVCYGLTPDDVASSLVHPQ